MPPEAAGFPVGAPAGANAALAKSPSPGVGTTAPAHGRRTASFAAAAAPTGGAAGELGKGGPLSQGIVHGRKVTCPLHGWNIGLEDGHAVAPDEGRCGRFEVKVEGGEVWLGV